MSICPSKDMHSLFADNELPEPYKSRFSDHVSQCAECSKIQKTYHFIDTVLHEDAAELSFSKKELNAGYIRLKARLSYKLTTAPEQKFSFSVFMWKAAPTLAAALILALFIPLRLAKQNENTSQVHLARFNTEFKAKPIEAQGIVVKGNIPPASLASMFGSNYALNIDVPKLASINVFKPELSKNTIQIRIILSNVFDSSQTAGNNFIHPVNLSGDSIP